MLKKGIKRSENYPEDPILVFFCHYFSVTAEKILPITLKMGNRGLKTHSDKGHEIFDIWNLSIFGTFFCEGR